MVGPLSYRTSSKSVEVTNKFREIMTSSLMFGKQ